MFLETLNWLTPLSEIFFRGPKIDFLLRRGTGNFVKMAKFLKILKFVFFICLCPYRTHGFESITWKTFLSTINALRKIFDLWPNSQWEL